MGLRAYRSNACGLPGCTWRLQKPTERAWARLALSIKRRNPGWRNIFSMWLCSLGYRGASCFACFSNLPPTCHLAPLDNRSTWSHWLALVHLVAYRMHCVTCQLQPRLTGSSRAVHSPLHTLLLIHSIFLLNHLMEGTPQTTCSGMDVSVVLQGSTTRFRVHSVPRVFHVRTLPRGF